MSVLPRRSPLPAWTMKVLATLVIFGILVLAAFGFPGALRLCIEAPTTLGMVYGLGIGASWIKDVLMYFIGLRGGALPAKGKDAEP